MSLPRTLLSMLLLAFCVPAMAQSSSYDEKLSRLSANLRVLMTRAEKLPTRDVSGRNAVQDELFELSKRLHRLQEATMRVNLELERKGSAPDRQLLLTASISQALDLAVSLTRNYLDTADKVFWSAALAAAQSARSLQAAR